MYLSQKYLEGRPPVRISTGQKGEAKKVPVTERLKGVKSLWGQEEKYTTKAV